MPNQQPPSNQTAGVRPISFVLDDRTTDRVQWIPLVIRPGDLTRTEPSRATVHQTLGRGDTKGWIDDFGPGLPSVNVTGHTGWRPPFGSTIDGMGHFEQLHQMITIDYAEAKQTAIDQGRDPADVRLLFIDTLDNFAYQVNMNTFVLKRNKSSPLLFQYQMTMQAVATDVDAPLPEPDETGDTEAGLDRLDSVSEDIAAAAPTIPELINEAFATVNGLLAPIGSLVQEFMNVTQRVFDQVSAVTRAINNGVSSTANTLIGFARDIAQAGVNIFRTVSAITSIPGKIRAALAQVAASYNEALCIFTNSLKPRAMYEDYSALYGASNCSSTTGGRPPSQYADMNVFTLISPERPPLAMSSDGLRSLASLKQADPVLYSMPQQEIGRHIENVVDGYSEVVA